MKKLLLLLLTGLLFTASSVYAAEGVFSNPLSLTLGAGKDSGSDTPLSIGMLFNVQEPIFFDFDIGRERELLDTTNNSVEEKKSISLNGHIGANLINTGSWTVGLSAIVGGQT